MTVDLTTAHQHLWRWCRAQDYAGYDPYDGLNSRLFQSTLLTKSRTARLAWTQLHKRSPINSRRLVRVPRERNSKGVALFALAALADYRRTGSRECEIKSRELLRDLMSMSLKGFKGAAWGYNFDWQSRSFFAVRGTPTIVPTAFAARALCEAAEVFGYAEYLPCARTVCNFILNDLNRPEETMDEVCFSYSPLDQTRVFNASLLAGEALAMVGSLSGEASLRDWSMRATRYVIRRQRADGSWAYGDNGHQSWADNFHTAFILKSLSRIISAVSSESSSDPGPRAGSPREALAATGASLQDLETALQRGYEFWRGSFFLDNGWPKYYRDRLYPADVHSAASAIVTLVELRGRIAGAIDLADRIAAWAIANLRDDRGFFYYQRRRFYTIRTAYMRWSEAWMMYGLSRLLEVRRI